MKLSRIQRATWLLLLGCGSFACETLLAPPGDAADRARRGLPPLTTRRPGDILAETNSISQQLEALRQQRRAAEATRLAGVNTFYDTTMRTELSIPTGGSGTPVASALYGGRFRTGDRDTQVDEVYTPQGLMQAVGLYQQGTTSYGAVSRAGSGAGADGNNFGGVPIFTAPTLIVLPSTTRSATPPGPWAETAIANPFPGSASRFVLPPPESPEDLGRAVARLAFENGFTSSTAQRIGSVVTTAGKAEPPTYTNPGPGGGTTAPRSHNRTGVPDTTPFTLAGWQKTANELREKSMKASGANGQALTKAQTEFAALESEFGPRERALQQKLEDLNREKQQADAERNQKGNGGPNSKNPNDQAKNDQGGGSPSGGAKGGGGGAGAAKGGDGAGAGTQGFGANGLQIPPPNTENTSSFQPSTFNPSSSIQSPGLGKNSPFNVGKFNKASGFSTPGSVVRGSNNSLGTSDDLTLQGGGKAGSSLGPNNSALGELGDGTANGNTNPFANGVAGKGGSGAQGGMGEVPDPNIAFEKGDPSLNPEKVVEFLAASGETGDEGGDAKVAKTDEEEEMKGNLNLALQLMPSLEDATGKRSILGYLGYIRKICRDYRREATGVCLNPIAKRIPVSARDIASIPQKNGPISAAARAALSPKQAATTSVAGAPKPKVGVQ